MNRGQSCAEFTLLQRNGEAYENRFVSFVGVARATPGATSSESSWHGFCGVDSELSSCIKNGDPDGYYDVRVGEHDELEPGDVLRVLLDLDAGTLKAKRNGELLTTIRSTAGRLISGLTGNYCWAAALLNHGASVRITELDPAAF